jgi:UPF0716 protein FxsA
MRAPVMLDDKQRDANMFAAQGIGMSLVKWAIFGLLMLPMVEIAVFVAVAIKLGVLAALALTILTSLAGMAIVRNAGHSEIARVRDALGDRTIRRVELGGTGLLTVLGGFLLVIPGFVTDVLGALLLFPPTRYALHAALRRAVAGAPVPAAPPGVVDLAPDQWERVPEAQIADERSPQGPPGRRD